MKRTSFLWLLLMILACGSGTTGIDDIDNLFEPAVASGEVENPEINEASGLTEGLNNPGMLWTHNDSGNKAKIYLLDENGKDKGSFFLKATGNRDWEDIACGPGPVEGKNYLYIGEIGDNYGEFEEKYIYRIQEPVPGDDYKILNIAKITFKYPDGKRDAECLMLDPLTKDIYIISKRENEVGLYRAAFPHSLDKIITLEKLSNIAFNNVVAGDISADGTEILLKTYYKIYYWKRKAGQSFSDALQQKPLEIPYAIEPQGEAIAWKKDGSGFFTLSEEPMGLKSPLYFYKRK